MKTRYIRSVVLAGILAVATQTGAVAQTVTLAVDGGDDDLERQLRNASLLTAAEDEGVTDPQELLAAARADYERLLAVLYDAGRFGGVINITLDGREAAAIPPLAQLSGIGTISVLVQPGPVYTFSQARIQPLAPETELPEGFTVGSPALTPVLRSAVGASIEGWRQTGYARAEVADQSLVVNHVPDTLAAEVQIAPGPLVTFGDLIPRGYSRVRPERIVAIAGLPTGEIYDSREVDEAADRLRRTGAFESVAVTEAEMLRASDILDITALVSEREPRRIGFGAEISSVDGLTLSGFWLHRNLLGGAERFRIEGELAQIGANEGSEDYSLGLAFERPATFGPDTTLYSTLDVEQLNEPTFSSQTAEAELGLSYIFSPELTGQAGLGFRYSRITSGGTVDFYRLVTLPLELTLDRRDNTLAPTEGYYADIEATPFLGLAGADSGARLTFDTRYFQSIGAEDRLVLAGRLQGGSVVGASIDGVPDDFLFFSGGGGTVRGQNYQSLGVDMGGMETGGLSWVGIQAEARFAVTPKLGVVAFYDWATVGPDSLPGDGGESHSGAGIGVRYSTPVGPVRLDLATPVSGPTDGQDFKVYIGIGQAF